MNLKPGIKTLPAGAKLSQPDVLLATWFGAGLLRPASGTIGSLAALPFGYAISFFTGAAGLGIAATILLILGTWTAHRYGKKSGTVDDQSIVVDEAVGLWIAALPAGTDPVLWAIAFFLFRLFDVWKPWPASYFDDRSRHGFDVMMDDVVAGFYALFGVAIVAITRLPA